MKEYYKGSINEIFTELETGLDGLPSNEAKKRLEKYGENKLKEGKKKSSLMLFISQFKDFMIILLIIASLFSLVISYIREESYIDSIIIIGIVFLNAILSFIQEKKADSAVEELNKMYTTTCYVIRDGKKTQIDVKEIVVGDIIELEAGDYIGADARIISADSLEVNESTLTGESKGIKKFNVEITENKELFERTNMVHSGCTVSNGHALVVSVATGMNTELGKIASSLVNNKQDITPLQKKINQISKVLTYIIMLIIAIMMIIGILMKNDFFDVLMLSISLAVAAIPEGLSSVITIILSLGMSDMAKKNVIIRKMASVETLGSTDIICSDKTGTITQNKMLVKSIYVNGKLYNETETINNSNLLYECATSCHNVVKNDEKYIGDETEVAIVKYLVSKQANQKYLRKKEYPFDSNRKMMTTINEIDNKTYSFTKGSLNSVINNCKYYIENNEIKEITNDYINQIYEIEKQESKKSLRLLAFAYKMEGLDNPETNMIFIGLIGMMDPPRENVDKSISICQKAGLKPIMITGDSINTAIAIAIDIGKITDESYAIEGKYIDKLSDEDFKKAVQKYQVYARVSPECKYRIVKTLQEEGYIVAMTGDGVNDAPAIQKADIGIGMGKTGTEVVKKVADCIIVDDSFSTIVNGVEEGRRITSNIKKVILYLLAGNIIEVILVFISMLLNMEMFSTLQLLWINLITDSIPAIMLAFEKSDEDIMTSNPSNKPCATFFTPFLIAKIGISAILKSIIMIIIFIYYSKTKDINIASSLLFVYLICNELLYSLSCRNLKKSVLNKNIFNNKNLTIGLSILTIIQILILTTPLSKFFVVKGITLNDYLIIITICFIVFIFGELLKPIYNALFKDYQEVKWKN